MPFFDLIIQWIEPSDFGPKSDKLGHQILKSDFIPSDFAKSDCISRPRYFSDRKIKIRSSESDRIINGPTFKNGVDIWTLFGYAQKSRLGIVITWF